MYELSRSCTSSVSARAHAPLSVDYLELLRPEDFATWMRIFDSHAAAHRAAGLILRHVARDLDETNDVYLAFEIDTVERALAFIDGSSAAETGRTSGVVSGDYRFAESVETWIG